MMKAITCFGVGNNLAHKMCTLFSGINLTTVLSWKPLSYVTTVMEDKNKKVPSQITIFTLLKFKVGSHYILIMREVELFNDSPEL